MGLWGALVSSGKPKMLSCTGIRNGYHLLNFYSKGSFVLFEADSLI